MDYSYEELKKKRVAELREIAAGIEHEAVQGYTQLNKEHLLQAICLALGIDTHAHHVVKDSHKATLKSRIKALKQQREEMAGTGDKKELQRLRRKLHRVKHSLRKMAV